MQKPAPDGVDTSTPNVARMWDYYLGGKDNFGADREAAERVLAVAPETREVARASREFLTRVVQQLVSYGVRQFIDIGSGLPTQGNVHEVAQAEDPEACVVYVDYDPVVCAHARALLERSDRVTVLQADVRRPDEILNSIEVRELIDLNEPVAVLLVSIVHFLSDDDDPAVIIARFHEAMAPGSYLVMNHASDTIPGRDQTSKTVSDVYRRSSAALNLRSREQVMQLFDGFELASPGLVWLAEWGATEPIENPENSFVFAGVGRKP